MKKERFFVTGGLGYIGSVFAQEALRRGHDVCLYDSLMYEQDRIRMLKEIKSCNKNNNEVELIIGDTRNTSLLKESVKKFKPTYFMHWGDLSSVWSCNHNPILTEDVSFGAIKNIVNLCEELNIPLFINSSSSVYGVQEKPNLMKEDDAIPAPTDLYCKYKLLVEEYIKEKKKKNKNLKVIIFRPATVFGLSPRFRIELLPNHFTYMAVAHKTIKVADLNAYRAAIDINELISGYFKVVEVGTWKKLIYNIGHHNISKIEYALGIQRVTGCKIVTIPDIGDLRNLQIDCERFNKEFDFKPQKTYDQSIEDIANWISANLKKIQDNNFASLLNMPLSNWIKISS